MGDGECHHLTGSETGHMGDGECHHLTGSETGHMGDGECHHLSIWNKSDALHSVNSELRSSICFEHYLLILRRRYTNGTWYIACVFCQLAATGLECNTPILLQPTDITRTQYTKFGLCSASWGWAGNARKIYRPLILDKSNERFIALVDCTVTLWCKVNKTLSAC
jgi:hypothetical protein